MRRTAATFCLLGLSGLLALAWAAAPPRWPNPAVPAEARAAPAPKAKRSLLDKLFALSMFAPIKQDRALTLKAVLDGLASAHDVPFEINERAFKFENLAAVDATPVVENAGLPGGKMTLARRLKQVLARVPAPSGATFLVRRDHLEITTGQFQSAELLPGEAGPEDEVVGPALSVPLVHLAFDRRPLGEALKALAEQVDTGIVLDPRVGEKAKAPVSANLPNAPLDTALFLMAEMADLRAVRLDSIFFVTTPEKAKALEADWKKFKAKNRALDGLPAPAPGAGGM
jgi:hypothetical protein